MHRSVRFLLIPLFAIPGAFPSLANEIPEDEVLAIDVLDDACITLADKFPENFSQGATSLPCEPLPVALDLRFMDDDYDNPTFELPVALDLDWEFADP